MADDIQNSIPSADAQDLVLQVLTAYHSAPAPNLGNGRNAAGVILDAAFCRLRQENEMLRADLKANADAWTGCEACGAPLFDNDDFVSDDCAGCWAVMTDAPDEQKQKHPCYAYRVGKPDARSRIELASQQGDG